MKGRPADCREAFKAAGTYRGKTSGTSPAAASLRRIRQGLGLMPRDRGRPCGCEGIGPLIFPAVDLVFFLLIGIGAGSCSRKTDSFQTMDLPKFVIIFN